ncbi:MAG: hypothetical protein MZV64_67805 [Ignavibacteriales bacterium]|nr:hypothetical protein [Ignavibacteriales bacterium]
MLHVEDDAAYASSVRILLKSEGFHAIDVRDGATALAQVTDSGLRPDVLIVISTCRASSTAARSPRQSHARWAGRCRRSC